LRPTVRSEGRGRAVGAGRVGEQQVDALVAEPREVGEVGRPPVDRGLVELEVAGVDDHPVRGAEGVGDPVGDRVADLDRLGVERALLDDVARLDLDELGAGRSGHSSRIASTNAMVSRVP
jgi:hypothetical protein